MSQQLTMTEEDRRDYEREVVQAASGIAIANVADVIGALIEQLESLKSRLGGSSGKVTAADRKHARDLAGYVVESIENDLPVNCRELVAAECDPERMLETESAVELVESAVLDSLKGLRQ